MCNKKLNALSLGNLSQPDRYSNPISLTGLQKSMAVDWLKSLILIRAAEEKIGEEFGKAVIKCPCHLVIGQEAPAVGLADHIIKGDRVFGAHRSHAHYLALGGNLHQLMAEVLGKETGCSKGMGGSMHLYQPEVGFHGSVPIVGSTIPIAVGAALSVQMDKTKNVAVSFLGDGATEEGVFHESLNFAANFRLPVIFIVENNLFSSHLHIDLRQPYDSTCRFSEANGIPWQRVDGNDVAAVSRVCQSAARRARSGKGPQFIEMVTYRWRGHVGHREDLDVGVKRKDDLNLWKKRDPIARLAKGMEKKKWLKPGEFERWKQEAEKEVSKAWHEAENDPYPTPDALLGRVYFQGNRR
jgi:TPP-dependent pyruvate/acetoin dehydrogenase alpha subunit